MRDGETDAEALAAAVDGETAAVFLQSPNFLGAVEDVEALGATAKEHGALLVVAVDPMTLGVLKPPGEQGADIALGEGQPLGNRLDFGGPSFGFFCASEELIRRMPGRIAGETDDVDGRRGFVLALQTREQHIRREKATHNICTAQALNALAAMIHLAWLGREGFRELGELLVRRTAYARERLAAVDGVELLHEAPVAREFAVRLDAPVDRVLERCAERGIAAGYPLGRDYPEHEDGLLVAITERRTRAQIDELAEALGAAVAAERGASVANRATNAPKEPADADRGDTDAARTGDDDLREVEAGTARRRPARRRSPRDAARGADPGRAPARRAAAPARGRRARDRPPLQPALAAQLRPRQRLLPARLLHDEAQPAAQRAGRGAARPRPSAPRPGPAAGPGRAGADVAAAGVARRDLRPAPRQPAALGGLARRARRPAAHPRLPRRPRRRAHARCSPPTPRTAPTPPR